MQTDDTLSIECHPPERRHRRTEIRMCFCCCTCCCCCLHTVGSIIGAAVAPAFGKNNRMPLTSYYNEEEDIAKPAIAAVKVFWLLTLAATVLGAFIGAAQERGGFVHLIILALVFPAIQLGSAIITAIWLCLSARPDKSIQLKQVGKITLGLFLGTIAGILSMVMIGVMFRSVL